VIEDFLDTIDISLEGLRDELSGGWLFGYIEALALVGVDTDLLCVSARVPEPVWWRHRPTGARIRILAATPLYKILRRRLRDPYAWFNADAIGAVTGKQKLLSSVARQLVSYSATPAVQLLRTIRAESYDAVICQEYEYPRFDVSVALGKLTRVPVFASFQGGNVPLTRLESAVRPWTLRACAGVIIGSEAEAERVRRRYRLERDKIGRIFNPLDLTSWVPGNRQTARHSLGIEDDALVVAWHGRVHFGVKGLDVLCEAWPRLKGAEQDRRRYLLLIGTGTDSDKLQQHIRTAQLQDVIWFDEYIVDHGRLLELLSTADVYVFPSRREGFPVAPLEAMACGLPVVAADVAGVSDILEKKEDSGGIIVPRGDTIALADALEKLLIADDWRAELGHRARRRVHEAFSLHAVGRQLRDFLVEQS
jgi:glycosyltransferase involved in cell wall biosynthesis